MILHFGAVVRLVCLEMEQVQVFCEDMLHHMIYDMLNSMEALT